MFANSCKTDMLFRSQACNPSGNGSSTVDADLYANTSCSVCNLSNDDELLMLCELCDSAVHTYCAGLGTEIPEGDWFCTDCMTAKEEHSRCEIDDDNSSDHGEFKITIEVPIADPVAAPSISDIVDEGHSPNLVQRSSVQSNRPSISDPVPSIYDIVDDDYTTIPIGRVNARSTRLDSRAERLPSQGISVGPQCPESPQERENSRVCSHARSRIESERARTLRNSRNLGSRIRELRENWSALRSGSIGFATQLHNRRRGNGAGTCDIEERHRSTTTFMEVAASSSGHAKKISPKNSSDVHKAWKMLEMAKSSGGKKKPDNPSSLNCSVPFSMGNGSTSYSPIDAILGHKNNKLYDGITQKNNAEQHHSTNMENKPPTMNFGECRKLQEKFHGSAHGRTPSTIMKQESVTGKVSSSSNNEKHNRSINMENRPPTVNFGEHRKLQESASVHGRIPSTVMMQENLNGKVASSSNNEDAGQIFESSRDVSRPEKSKPVVSCPLTFSLLSGQSMVTSSQQLRPGWSQSTEMVSSQEPSATAASIDIGTAGANDKVKGSRPDRLERKRKLGSETHDDKGSKRSMSSCKIRKSDISFLAIRELKLLNIDKTYGMYSPFDSLFTNRTFKLLPIC